MLIIFHSKRCCLLDNFVLAKLRKSVGPKKSRDNYLGTKSGCAASYLGEITKDSFYQLKDLREYLYAS